MTGKISKAERRRNAIDAALGKKPFDTLLAGGQVLELVTGKLIQADVGIAGQLIAAVLPAGTKAQAKNIEDVSGQIVTPGLFDAHMHVESSLISKAAYAQAVLPHGVTTIAWDPHDLANVLGAQGVSWAREANCAPLRAIVQVPSCVPSNPGKERVKDEAFASSIPELLAASEGSPCLAEVMDMRAVLEGEKRMQDILDAADAAGALICGHARDLKGLQLQAYAAAGIHTDHEVTSGEDLLAKLRAGLGVELRGSHPHLLPEFVEAIKSLRALPPTLTLCTDDVFPDELVESGGLAWVVGELIRLGMDPVDAWRAATHNPALRYGIRDLGLVAPGRIADLLVVPSLETVKPNLVLCAGQVVARDGQLAVQVGDDAPVLGALTDTVHAPEFSADDFKMKVHQEDLTEIPSIDQPRFTRWGKAQASVNNGYVELGPNAIWMAVGHRHGQHPCKMQLAALTEWGQWNGAFATTFSHDAHNLTVFGSNAQDMCLAANKVAKGGGGMAVYSQGKELAFMHLPLAGLMSDQGPHEAAEYFRTIRQELDGIVSDWQAPNPPIKACVGASLVCNPGPRLSDVGVVEG